MALTFLEKILFLTAICFSKKRNGRTKQNAFAKSLSPTVIFI